MRHKILRHTQIPLQQAVNRGYSSQPVSSHSVKSPQAKEDDLSLRKQEAQISSNGDAKPKKKTIAELDEELRLKLENISGDGGVSGLEYENGKPVAMKRGVKDNMFRVI